MHENNKDIKLSDIKLKDITTKEFLNNNKIIRATTQIIVALYLLSLFTVISLFYLNKYYNMGIAKYYYFKCMSLSFLPLIGILCILYSRNLIKAHSFKKICTTLSITDIFVLGYTVIILVSYLLSSYQSIALTGTLEWNMGLISQLIFVAIYFVTSRFFTLKKWYAYFFLGVSAIVFLIGILNRFSIDPLFMYDSTNVDRSFLSTIGQPSWYSSYLCTIFPLGLFLYWHSSNRKDTILYGFYCFISFCTLVTQNSDSAYISLVLIFLCLFLVSFDQMIHLLRWFEILLIALAAFQIMGFLELLFPAYAFQNDTLSIMVARHPLIHILFGVIVVLYVSLYLYHKGRQIQIDKLHWIPKLMLSLFVIGLVTMIILILCATTRHLPTPLQPLYSNHYFVFDNHWGNERGVNWKYAIRIFQKLPLHSKLFGTGPDCYGLSLSHYYGEQIQQVLGNVEFNNAHNEWLNSLITTGIFGLLSYGGIFISQIYRCIRQKKNNTLLIGVVLCIISYIGNNTFGYQQVVCTPIIFIILGVGEHLLRTQCTASK